jgi:hypothetical protein
VSSILGRAVRRLFGAVSLGAVATSVNVANASGSLLRCAQRAAGPEYLTSAFSVKSLIRERESSRACARLLLRAPALRLARRAGTRPDHFLGRWLVRQDAAATRTASARRDFPSGSIQPLPASKASLQAREAGPVRCGALIPLSWRPHTCMADAATVQPARDPDAIAGVLAAIGHRDPDAVSRGRGARSWYLNPVRLVSRWHTAVPGRKGRASAPSAPASL